MDFARVLRRIVVGSLILVLSASHSSAATLCAFDYKCRQARVVRKYLHKTWGIAEAGKLSADTVRAVLDVSYSTGSVISYFEVVSLIVTADKIVELVDDGRYAEAQYLGGKTITQTALTTALTGVGLGGVAIITEAATAPIVFGLEQFVDQVRKTTLQKHLTAYFVLRKLGLEHEQILNKNDGGFAVSYSDDGWILDVQCDFIECRGNHFATGGRPLNPSDSAKVYGMAEKLWDVKASKDSYLSDNAIVADKVRQLIAGVACSSAGFQAGTVCNTGRLGNCANGTWSCARDVVKCVPNNSQRREVCGDQIDNDCDGRLDDGCPDEDGDGIADGNDACPSTPAGILVDSAGCACSQKTCEDGNVCTQDSCNPATAACVFTNSASPCDDGNSCTVGDQCGGGVCQSGLGGTCGNGVIDSACSEQCDGTDDGVCPGLCQPDCSCGAAPTPTPTPLAAFFFEDTFDGTVLDSVKWSGFTNGYPDPAITVTDGELQLGQQGVGSLDFPYVVSSAVVFPATGDLSLEFALQYASVGTFGNGVVVLGPANEQVMEVWHDSSQGLLAQLSTGPLIGVAAPLDRHIYRLDVVGGGASLFIDDTLIATGALGARPQRVWLGHPTIGQTLSAYAHELIPRCIDPSGTMVCRWWSDPDAWTTLKADYLRVSQ